jgi:hypothetical protein
VQFVGTLPIKQRRAGLLRQAAYGGLSVIRGTGPVRDDVAASLLSQELHHVLQWVGVAVCQLMLLLALRNMAAEPVGYVG